MRNRVVLTNNAATSLGTTTVSGTPILDVYLSGSAISLIGVAYDYIAVTYPSSTQEVYVFKSGGVSGTTVATVTVNYTDSTKANLLNVART